MIKLEFAESSRKPVWILDKPVYIGSGEENQLTIKDPTLSPRHATICFESGNYVLKDLGSVTGTFVKGQRISQRCIKNHDTIRIGNVELEVIDVFEPNSTLQSWSLIACSHHLNGEEFPLTSRSGKSSIKVGRADHCDIIFPETHLSREHAVFEPESEGVRVTDLSSIAGTYLNDHRITTGLAKPGDRIRFDIYSFVLVGPTGRDDESPDESHTEAAAFDPLSPLPAQATSDPECTEASADTSSDDMSEAAPKSSLLPILIAGSLISAAIAAGIFLFQ